MMKFIGFLSVYFFDRDARFNAAILLGLIFNACYIVFNLVLGILQANAWYITVAAYYTLIVVLRYTILDFGDSAKETAETVSLLLTVVAFPTSGMIIYTVIAGSENTQPLIALPIFAIYAVVGIFRSAKGLVFRKNTSPPRRIAYNIKLSLALLSLFNFQTSLLPLLDVSRTLALALNFFTGGSASIAMLRLAGTIRNERSKGFDNEKI